MDVLIVGAGPTGLTLGAALAQRRHRVVAIDSDPGPAPDGSWRRRGVMQFNQAHGFRPQVHDLLQAEWPAAWRSWRDLGAEPVDLAPGASAPAIGIRSVSRGARSALLPGRHQRPGRRCLRPRSACSASRVVPGLPPCL